MNDPTCFSRRHFLKASVLGAGAAFLAACAPPGAAPAGERAPGGGEGAAQAEIVLLTSGWPVTPMPSEADLEADPARAGYLAALQAWMAENPGVTIEQVEVNIWDTQAIMTAVAGGTAPAFTYGLAIGGWSLAGTQAAFKQGLMADITPYVEFFELEQKLTDSAAAVFNTHGQVDGRAYYYPIDSGYNGGIWYRKDLITEMGLNEPTVDWTWDDFHALAAALTSQEDNRWGFGAPAWIAGTFLSGHGFDILSWVPAPETGWNWRRDFSDPQWAQLAEEFRSWIFDEGIIYSDAAVGASSDYSTMFADGRLGMTTENILGAFGSAAQETSVAALAERLGKAYEDVVGFAPMPRGNGYVENGLYLGGVSFSPDLTQAALEKAVSIVDYMFLGEGWDIQKQKQYEATNDLQAVFNYPFPIDGKREYEGVPGTFADAWGQSTLTRLEEMAALPMLPERALYFPSEENPGPDTQAIDDLWSTLMYVADVPDVAEQFRQTEQIWNQQADGFSSSIPDDVFIDGARAYYTALDEFWQEASPDFYESQFRPYYQEKVLPALGQ